MMNDEVKTANKDNRWSTLDMSPQMMNGNGQSGMDSSLLTWHRPLPADRLELLKGWGGAVGSAAYVYRPSTIEQLKDAFVVARAAGRRVTLRGAGRSYGDAALGRENVTIDFTRMNRILSWDAELGIITCEPGVTIKQLWEYSIEDGWWPPVVPGTMFPTLGGVLAMNIHGKNNFKVGTIGEHVLAFDFLAAFWRNASRRA